VNTLICLIAAAFMVVTAIYLGQQGLRLRRANNLLLGVVKNMNETKPWALTKPQGDLRLACELLHRSAGYVPYSNADLRQRINTFLLDYPPVDGASNQSGGSS
jgi:hypothetical protein